jgi:pimeloyl-ACP methyl ester carboxylesterase
MLAKLLRRLIFAQITLGLAIGYFVSRALDWPLWTMYCSGAALPFVTMLAVDTISALISRNSDEPAGHWWRSLFGEFSAGIRVFIFRQPWTTQTPTLLAATGASKKLPVVLVHGYLCNHRIWDDMVVVLRANGHDVFAVNLEPVFCSIDGYARIIERAVSELIRHSGRNEVALVGHSMGGLAIRAWLRVHGSQRVARIITLGTPHAGTKIARGSPTANGRQMNWRSEWLRELATVETEAIRALMLIGLTPQDNIVFNQRDQVLEGISPVIFEGIGHVQMCLAPSVIAWVQGRLAELEPVSCVA